VNRQNRFSCLSRKVKVALAGIFIQNPSVIAKYGQKDMIFRFK
jgi:hypothetical protein